jgi:hypothetical protein
MEIKMAENNPYAAYSSTQLYMDATGKGAQIAQPVADPKKAVIPQYFKPLAQQGQPLKDDVNPPEDVDYLSSLFDGEDLSEDFKEKARTIFQAAINEKVSIIEKHIIDASKEIIEEQLVAQQSNLVEHVDNYLGYVISEWMEENKVAIERGLRTEIAENFMMGLKDLFESSFIDVPEEKYNILDDLYAANEELQENANSLIKENIHLKNEITARLCAEAFIEEATGLADTQVEKLAKLAEGIEFANVDQYRQKVSLLKESYFGSKKVEQESNQSSGQMTLTEDSGSYVTTSHLETNPMMENIVNAITVINKNRPSKPAFKSLNDSAVADRIQAIMNPMLKDK